MFLLEYEEDIIVIDCGVAFPHEDQLGIDLVFPIFPISGNIADRVRAIFITHGHEDHIGALPFHLAEINVPVYATRLTIGLITVKLEEAKLLGKVELRELDPESPAPVLAGVFAVEPFRVCHTFPTR